MRRRPWDEPAVSDAAPNTVAVVVPTFNDGPWLARCLASIAAQTRPPDEIVVVDDGSADPAPARDAVAACPGARLVRQDNGGAAAARNRGLAEVGSHWVAFVDSDDRLTPDNLERRMATVRDRPELGSAYTGYVAHAPGRPDRRSRFGRHDGAFGAADMAVPGGIPAGLPMHLLRVDAVRALGGLDTTLPLKEDFDLLIRMGRAGWHTAGTNDPLYLRALRPGSLSRGSGWARWRGQRPFVAKAWAEGYYPKVELLRQEALALALLARDLARERL